MKKLVLLLFVFICSLYASARTNFWTDAPESSFLSKGKRSWIPSAYRTLHIDLSNARIQLKSAPSETHTPARLSESTILLPAPSGGTMEFRLAESLVMAPELAAAFPGIRTYSLVSTRNSSVTGRLDITEHGLHAMIFSEQGVIYIDPYVQGTTEEYITYYKKDILGIQPSMICETGDETDGLDAVPSLLDNHIVQRSIGTQLRTYRLALACTGEYAQFFGGTVSGALSGMVTSINRCNGIYERELGIRLVLVPNDTLLIYLSANSDPYHNNNGSTMLSENQSNINSVIGSANYDIGHVFSTGGGGIAYRGCVCSNSNKARGVTGSSAPVGDPFDVDYVAHEMGHQFGANHTFNATSGSCSGNRVSSAAFEPGSASTIMGYAGICGSVNDLQTNSDAYYHSYSLDEITWYMVSGAGNSCASVSATGNTPPVVLASGPYVIPYMTPFRLTATASDPNGDPITYCWEELDHGPSGNWNSPSGDAPIFRSFDPQSSPTRFFPAFPDVLNNSVHVGELKPAYARTMHFRCSVRDNRSGGGGVMCNDTAVQVDAINTGTGFAVTYPNAGGISWMTGTQQTVTWDVAQSDVAPVSTPFVNIRMSVDNGNTFPILLASGVPNTGSCAITVPSQVTPAARIWIEGAGNIFYNVSNNSFAVTLNTGIPDPASGTFLSVYPNPGKGLFELALSPSVAGMLSADVFDAIGSRVYSGNLRPSAGHATIDLSNLNDGVYFLRLIHDGQSSTHRLVLVH